MDSTFFRNFFQSKLEIARFLVSERSKEAEPDAEIILCCALSGLATILWPGKWIDRQRFIQLLIEYSPSRENLQRISTPALALQLDDEKEISSAIEARWFSFHPTEQLLSERVDKVEIEISTLFPSIALKTIRSASYASIIYTDFRCALVHEYKHTKRLTDFDLWYIHDRPSYVNMTGIDGRTRRLLYFPFEYLVKLFEATTENLFDYWNKSTKMNKPQPEKWWADG